MNNILLKIKLDNAKNPIMITEQQNILQSKSRLAFLDVLRFFAAFIVVAHMHDSNVATRDFSTFDLKKDFSIFYTGVAGVIIFF